jgi:hypothetical protein
LYEAIPTVRSKTVALITHGHKRSKKATFINPEILQNMRAIFAGLGIDSEKARTRFITRHI